MVWHQVCMQRGSEHGNWDCMATVQAQLTRNRSTRGPYCFLVASLRHACFSSAADWTSSIVTSALRERMDGGVSSHRPHRCCLCSDLPSKSSHRVPARVHPSSSPSPSSNTPASRPSFSQPSCGGILAILMRSARRRGLPCLSHTYPGVSMRRVSNSAGGHGPRSGPVAGPRSGPPASPAMLLTYWLDWP